MFAFLKTLLSYRDLLLMWTLREIKVRYKQSILGGAWAVLQPLSLTLVFTVVFSYLVRVPSDGIPYPIFAYSAVLPWTLLATSISFAVPSLVNNSSLVTKIYFPREIIPLASIGAAIIDFLVAALIFIGMMILFRIPPTSSLIWLLPLLLIQIALMIGVSLLASAINVFYRDIRLVVPLALQIWMYASPVIYPVSVVPESLRLLYMLNPMAGLITSYRRVILEYQPPLAMDLLVAAAVSLLLCVLGYSYFKRWEPGFADVV
ncbi:MAG: ABC transporter permease [Chloroflexota bacterium]|jgi:lipopolysaccharide transport system permease protein